MSNLIAWGSIAFAVMLVVMILLFAPKQHTINLDASLWTCKSGHNRFYTTYTMVGKTMVPHTHHVYDCDEWVRK